MSTESLNFSFGPYFAAALTAGVFLLSLMLAGFWRKMAIRRQILDRPNARSSHTQPTPRGGGIAIVISCLAGLTVLWQMGVLTTSAFYSLIWGGAGIAALGLIDDVVTVRAVYRLLAQILIVTGALVLLADPASLLLPEGPWILDGWAWVIVAAGLVWLLNLYNFMDGINGIASVQAIFACFTLYICTTFIGSGAPLIALTCLVLAAAALGFLPWNFPKARLFMGDVGSAFLGLMLGLIALQHSATHPAALWMWLTALSPFWVDATYTLIQRARRKERLLDAHRQHAYQILSRRLKSHTKTVRWLAGLNVLWILPLAALSATHPTQGLWITILCVLPQIAVVDHLKAGTPNQYESNRTESAGPIAAND